MAVVFLEERLPSVVQSASQSALNQVASDSPWKVAGLERAGVWSMDAVHARV